MNHYQQTLVLDADSATVFAALTTAEGLRGWWTQDCDVASAVGDTIHFRFGPNYKDMQIERLEPGRLVQWRCTRAHIAAGELRRRDEWVGTQIVFRLSPVAGGRTRLDFEHIGLVPELDCYELCSGGWQYFLTSLQQYVGKGRGTPHELQGVCQAHAASLAAEATAAAH